MIYFHNYKFKKKKVIIIFGNLWQEKKRLN